MVLINENIIKAMTMLEELLINYVEKEINVCIHGNVDSVMFRYSSIINEYHIEPNEFCLICGWFELEFRKEMICITYDEELNSIHIMFENGELYIDINEDF